MPEFPTDGFFAVLTAETTEDDNARYPYVRELFGLPHHVTGGESPRPIPDGTVTGRVLNSMNDLARLLDPSTPLIHADPTATGTLNISSIPQHLRMKPRKTHAENAS